MFKLTNEMSNKIQICRAIAIIAVVIIHNCPQEMGGDSGKVFC